MHDRVNETIRKYVMEHGLPERDVGQEDADDRFRVVIVGCGGAGINTIDQLHRIRMTGAETIAVDTDRQHLDMVQADRRILIGKSLAKGLGAGGSPEVGRRTAEMARWALEEALDYPDLCFLTAGMGGGTGTGAAPVVAQMAKDQGATVIGLVGYPYNVETACLVRAKEGLAALHQVTGPVVVLDNNRLGPRLPARLPGQGFTAMDRLIAETIAAICETITERTLIMIDHADLRTLMSRDGVAVMLTGESDRGAGARSAALECLSNPMFDIDYRGATGALIHVTGGSDLTLEATEEIVSELEYELDPHADVIWGARTRSGFDGRVRVVAIMTGIGSARASRTTR